MNTDCSKWRILCIDDDLDVLAILKSTLGIRHEVVTAQDGFEAVAMLDFCDADFIICDVRMPLMDGFQTVEAIRRHPQYQEIPVFFLTGETDRDMAKRGFASGANLYLTKPFDPIRLLKNVEYFLQESNQQPRTKRLDLSTVAKAAQAPAKETQQSMAPRTASPARPSSRQKARVIIICSNTPQLRQIHDALDSGFECVACADPLGSLQRLFRYEPDVLVINPTVPGLSGWGLVQMIRQNPRLGSLPVVLAEDDLHPIDPRMASAITQIPILNTRWLSKEILALMEEIVSSPEFSIRLKTANIDDLVNEETKLRNEKEKELERAGRQEQARREKYRKIQEFIDTQLR